MSNKSLALKCLVLGNKPPSEYVFPVNIPRNKTVSHLQAAIKTQGKHTLDIDEDLLYLWSVSIAIDDTFDAKLANFEPSYGKGCHRLLPTTELSDIFHLECDHLHVVVQPPDDGEIKLP